MEPLITTPESKKKAILLGIRKALLDMGTATKAELSEKLGISFPTASKFLSQMEKDGEVITMGLDLSSGGRRAHRYRYNPEHMLGLAVFLEKTETVYTIFNCLGEVKEQGAVSSVLSETSMEAFTRLLDGLIQKHPKISALSIGVPGAVNQGHIIYIPEYPQFQNRDVQGYYEERFSIPVVVENDMNAAVLGYSTTKKMIDNPSLVYVCFGQNGPGSGILINGDVVRGSTFFTGEVSFVPQYEHQNFLQALQNEEQRIDAISRLIASFTAILNPQRILFSQEEMTSSEVRDIQKRSSRYIPGEHLPELALCDWKQDYLNGLKNLGLKLMISAASAGNTHT
ncbi:ROK family transcriptional regulator [Fictibacillus fluitans]|uniref:ROK family protein n=1 Tax=Fictibacillus fluitans TaxID=3058422 RepID=A0ABT8HZ19_9BACL|nr:ROK family transcriptional regulator [Fictibacillus sp. NE201]MDN4526017.1 ROK family protein [Fictibacillus sp. NE201]